MKIKKETLVFFLIILLGTALRFYRIEENLQFHGELGYDYTTIKNLVLNSKIPLLGPPTSRPWFSLGPMFYWIFSVALPLANYHPLVGAYIMAIVGVLGIILGFYIVKEFFGVKAGLITSYLIAISPSWLDLTRRARLNYPAAVLFFPLFYFLTKNLQEKGKHLFWTGFILGLSWHFFGGFIVLIIASGLILFLKRKDIKKSEFGKGLLGFAIPFSPFILYNLLNKFEMLIQISLWIPYRILGFFGLYPKNTADTGVIKSNLISLYNFFIESWLPDNNLLAQILFITIIVFAAIKTKRNLSWNKKHIPWMVLILLFTISYLGIFVHGNPPSHYYLIIYPIPIIFMSILLGKLLKKGAGKIVVYLLLIMITFTNINYFFSDKWFFISQNVYAPERAVPYKLQEEITKYIYKDAKGRNFELARVGPYDYFEADYALNYHYLLWRLGNEPQESASLRYTIYEDTSNLEAITRVRAKWVDNIAIVKGENED